MTTTRTIGQTPPDRANDLFFRLLETTNDAVLMREELFGDLKQELRLLADLHEQHLFPVLERHPDTADLVRDARADNRQTEALLIELENTPKDNDGFVTKVAELRSMFQQHIRNDKDELLPVVLKVLSEDEVEAVVEKVEEEIAEVAQTKRAAAKRGRKPAASALDAGGTLLTVVEAEAESVQNLAQAVGDTVQDQVKTASETVERTANLTIEITGRAEGGTPNLVNRVLEPFQASIQSNRALVRGVATIALEWAELRQERLQNNLDRMNDLLQCRSLTDVLTVQSALVRENIERIVENNQRLAQLTAQVTHDAVRTITVPGKPDLRVG
jgi:Phasin protein/Hemerythrin HHE cation binding domain